MNKSKISIKFKKLYYCYRRNGFIYTIKLLLLTLLSTKIIAKIRDKWIIKNQFEPLRKILTLYRHKPLIIFPPIMDWDIPLFQRSHHLALELARQGFLCFFFTKNFSDRIKKIQSLSEHCFLLPSVLYDITLEFERDKILFLCIYPTKLYSYESIDKLYKKGCKIIYDYLDDYNEQVFGVIDHENYERHKNFLSDERFLCLTTADKLYQDALNYRKQNVLLIENAVDIHHYTKSNTNIKALERKIKGRKVIGYFGALAAWIDYQLLKSIAETNVDKVILLIGHKYDNQFDANYLNHYDNIILLRPVSYKILPNYAQYFDISIIPFLINETTLATSPLKLFEYMALGKPIISTALPECKKYQSALIANNYTEFNNLIEMALNYPQNHSYFSILKNEASKNTWEARASIIVKALNY